MNTSFRFILTTLLVLAALIALPLETKTSSLQQPSSDNPIVARVQNNNGRAVISITPDPAPGKDPLFELNLLREKLGPQHPVVAIVDEDVKIFWLWQVSGIAGKAGFDKTRTFIRNLNNGKMFEVNFGPALPYSKPGPFEPK